ncbi:uncharacterized protein N7506_011238 [Penicillium brevicompactum]|uniref:uncharacterized protein n=1 Tax=Penicillium brevicompactum TaxID=5074 RepID=UPI00254170D0|nr:uncharacterized protein N7506_011238 [Penicillium brevicompactum]KAJ5322108.1 hypothetical protein N7506_011238 [Penicillium brevicompactum]
MTLWIQGAFPVAEARLHNCLAQEHRRSVLAVPQETWVPLALSTAPSFKLLVAKVQQTFGRDHIVSVAGSCVHQSSLTPGEYDGSGEWQNVLFIADGYVFKSSPRGEETRWDSRYGYTEPVLV